MKKYKCNCPDFAKTQSANPYAGSLSLWINRDWQSGSAELNPPGFCKHIWAVMLYEKEEAQPPSDVPVDRSPRVTVPREPGRLNRNANKGDYFGF
jgi:SWIM zinc finger